MIFEQIFDPENIRRAWRHVPRKSPAGIDRVTYDTFSRKIEMNLHTLGVHLREGKYQPMPVSVFDKQKKGSASRVIGISTIRDKVAQQAVLQVIGPVFERMFLPCSCAYRPGKSALDAVKTAAEQIEEGNLWVLQMDVADFFDTLHHGLLIELIRKVVDEKPFIRLLTRLLKAKIFKEMGLFDTTAGTQQGSGLSPLLSNIYLHPMDLYLWKKYKNRYIRYSDDITLFADDRGKLEAARQEIERCLKEMKLSVNADKTVISHVSSGFVYLGFHMDAGGRGPDKKSVIQLQNRLRAYDKIRKTDDADAKKEEIRSIVRGWYNYYHTLKPVTPPNILSLIVLSELAESYKDVRTARRLLKQSTDFPNRNPRISFILAELFNSHGMRRHALREYARALEGEPENEVIKERVRAIQESDEDIYEQISQTQMLLHHNPRHLESYEKLRRLFTRLGLFGFAEKAHEKALEIDAETVREPDWEADGNRMQPDVSDFDHRSVDPDVFMTVFAGRSGIHARQWVDERGKWGFSPTERPLKRKDVIQHLRGEITLGAYPVTGDDHVRYIVFDVDTARRRILESEPEALTGFRREAHEDILRIRRTCEELGVVLHMEDSGYKGRHGWVFFTEPRPAASALKLGQEIMKKAGGPSEGIIWELFPMGKSERHNSVIKLPLGINRKNNRRCLFLTDSGEPVSDQGLFLKTLKRTDFSKIKGMAPEPTESGTGGAPQIWEDLSPGLRKMVTECRFINRLICKAKDTNYLSHFERICLLYTLSFAGDEGCRFLHRVIGFCINYSSQITQRQIERRKESPISCPKMREYFPDIAKAVSCDCKFAIPPSGYPSPVLYLLVSEIESACGNPFENREAEAAAPPREEKPAPEPPPVEDDGPGLLDFNAIFSEESQNMIGEKSEEPRRPEPSPALSEEKTDTGEVPHEQDHGPEPPSIRPSVPDKPDTSPPEAVSKETAEAPPVRIPGNVPKESHLAEWENTLKLMKLLANRRRLDDEIRALKRKLKMSFKNRKSGVIKTSFGRIRWRMKGDEMDISMETEL